VGSDHNKPIRHCAPTFRNLLLARDIIVSMSGLVQGDRAAGVARLGVSSRPSREAVGKARLFIQRAGEDAKPFVALLGEIKALALHRRKQRGGRGLRRETVADIDRKVRSLPGRFRLDYTCEQHGQDVTLRFTALLPAKACSPQWGPEAQEPEISVIVATLSSSRRGGITLQINLPVSFSLHAIARRIERGRRVNNGVLFAEIAQMPRTPTEADIGREFTMSNGEGEWRGVTTGLDLAVSKEEIVKSLCCFAVRTWVPT
jgi:hypothetical protein